jgi:hypothetical protein
MNAKYLKYNYYSLQEKVLQGNTAKGQPVIYAVPDILTDTEAEVLIDTIEQNAKLAEIVRNPKIRSGTPEWASFWAALSAVPAIKAMEKAHGAANLHRYRISRTLYTTERPEMEDFDAKLKADNRPSLPSFQDHWEDYAAGREGAVTRQDPRKGKDQQQNTGTTFKQSPVKGKDQPE